MENMNREESLDLNLLIAMFRCFTEQLYCLKGHHSRIVKLKFNRLLKVARQYEKELLNNIESSEEIDAIYDNLMDILMDVRTKVLEYQEQQTVTDNG